MHPLIHVQTQGLYELPDPLKEIALVAVSRDCTDFEFTQFANCWSTSDERTKSLLSPALFAILDPTRIPQATELATLSAPSKKSISRALAILESLLSLTTEEELPETIFELSPSVVAWVRFAYDFHGHASLAADNSNGVQTRTMLTISKSELLVSFIRFSRLVDGKWMDHPMPASIPNVRNPSDVFWNTPGFLALVIHAWAHAISNLSYPLDEPATDLVLDCMLSLPEYFDHTQLDEMIQAAGGTLDCLVSLIKAHLVMTHALPLHIRTDRYIVAMLAYPLILIVGANDLLDSEQQDSESYDIVVARVLLAHNIFPDLFQLLSNALHTPPQPGVSTLSCWRRTLHLVIDVTNLLISTGPDALHEALRHDMIPQLLATARFLPDKQLSRNLTRFIQKQLPRGLVYPSTLPLIVDGIDGIEKSNLGEFLNDPNSPLFPLWSRLKKDAAYQERILLVLHSQGVRAQLVACDNPPVGLRGPTPLFRSAKILAAALQQCSRIKTRDEFKRCSGCYLRIYCSKACQTVDWREGNHRSICAATKTEYTRPDVHAIFSKPQLAMFRLSLHSFYTDNILEVHTFNSTLREETVQQQLLASPNSDPRPVMLNIISFRDGVPQINQLAIRSALTLEPDARKALLRDIPTLDDWIDRARRSNGRMLLHIMVVPIGVFKHALIFPLRMNMAFLEDAALRAARSIDGREDYESVMQLATLFQATRPPERLVAIHQ
ncbi:MYND-type domain-containing protein [Mycena indigotica]|uniref:MYND-type domain-containing protein n=1 Tax=Mycena indigotica TaxID=2126181 RepID=A0A8H6W075_9AGAR|nr:MYND-type domain-containing protein [Mycena indigotica]KAF7296778.1 MYND-type domain-containing protein [Mycena indigotica]